MLQSTEVEEETILDRSASAVWRGSLKEGKGTISTQSRDAEWETQYSFAARFESGVGITTRRS